MQKKPELLLPAGNVESFYAAIEAGADAVYLGTEIFNARSRAQNFSRRQLVAAIHTAHENKVKVYITLNTVIKNKELDQLVEELFFLSGAGVDAIIVQDPGVLLLAAFFPQLRIHASTQMGIHNSAGIRFLAKRNVSRVVLARELTMPEIIKIVSSAETETEVFVHGALCYSFSGMCLFSSYLGGRSANRGLCAQPCRRRYETGSQITFPFNLKDNQLIRFVPQLAETGIDSLKIEGRMKSGDYAFITGKAYRMVLDNPLAMDDALILLSEDFGRQKTTWFAGGELRDAINGDTASGKRIGTVKKVFRNKVLVLSTEEIKPGYRLRMFSAGKNEPCYVQVEKTERQDGAFLISPVCAGIAQDSPVYLVKTNNHRLRRSLPHMGPVKEGIMPVSQKSEIFALIRSSQPLGDEKLYFRIASEDWMSRINWNELDGLFISFSRETWQKTSLETDFFQSGKEKIFIELPPFISEKSISFYAALVKRATEAGIRNFVTGQLWQKELLPGGACVISSEQAYVFNDAAVTFIRKEGYSSFVYPLENDFDTLESLSDKSGIVPVYFYPPLFYSRMPVKLEEPGKFSLESENARFRRFRRNGMTTIVPDRPVSILQHKDRLINKGFRKFLIDLSYEPYSKNRIKTLKVRYLKSEQVQPSTTFNFVKGIQ